MKIKRSWDIASTTAQNPLHDYVEKTYTMPKLAEIHKGISVADNQYDYDAKNQDRKLTDTDDHTITIERKIDRSFASDDITFEIFCNLKMNNWNTMRSGRYSAGGKDHKSFLDKIRETHCSDTFKKDKNSGLLLANLCGSGVHYTQMIRYYKKQNRAEAWLLNTKWLQREVWDNIQNVDVAKVIKEKHGNKWDTIIALISMPSVVRNAPLNIDGDSIVGNWELPIKTYHELVIDWHQMLK